MIIEALAQQFVQRFQHEKRAQVCLWFDERREFARLLPAFRRYLASLQKGPFDLLEYDQEKHRGQLWLKHQVHRARQAAGPEERGHLRFVMYLPLPEDCLDGTGAGAGPSLELLAEYRVTGILWRINGKRPTLFSFLRQTGVALPESPADQRRLYDGDQNSLLAKYAAKFADRPAVFWATALTAEVAQSRLVGDADQTLLDLAVDPDGTWTILREKGLEGELLEVVRERYGFDAPDEPPSEWMRTFVAQLALTEVFLGYREPKDFPFLDRLPPEPLRTNHLHFLRRWLRDSESRVAWDRWIQEVETGIDLSSWAKGRSGLAFGFPHLVRARWEEIWALFEEAAPKTSSVADFFRTHEERIAAEAEFAGASATPAGRWALLRELNALLQASATAQARIESLASPADFARIYVEAAPLVELRHLRIRFRAEEDGLPAVARVADRAYGEYANALNTPFFIALVATKRAEIPGISPVAPRMEEKVWHAKGRRAVVIVDALRYDCAHAVKESLREQEVTLEPLVASLPTVTPIGMTALLPTAGAMLSLEVKGNALHPKVNGTDTSVLSNRITFLRDFGAHCLEIHDAEDANQPPEDAGDLLVVFGHDAVDHMGHGKAHTLVRHLQLEVDRLVRLIRKLHRWGYPTVHLVTDHGFILLDESHLPPEVPCEKDWCIVRKERFALVPSGPDLPVATFPFPWDPTMRVAVPPGLAFFKAEKSFSHGGASLQELVIPHLVSKSRIAQEKRVGVELVLPTFELMRATVKVVLRPQHAKAGAGGQMLLFSETGRTLMLDVVRTEDDGSPASVLAAGPKEVRLEPDGGEQSVTLFFHSAASFRKGDLLELDIRDVETTEQFPPGGIKLTVGRDM